MAQKRRQGSLFRNVTADENRIRVKGSLDVAVSEALELGDTAELTLMVHVKELAFKLREDETIVREQVVVVDLVKVDGAVVKGGSEDDEDQGEG